MTVKDTLELFAAIGDRQTREMAHTMDLCIAGAIDVLVGHGTVTIKPARLEELVERIAPRQRDADGNWIVTLLPSDDEAGRRPEVTSMEIASLAGRVMGMPEAESHQSVVSSESYNQLLAIAKRLAGSALTQAVDNRSG